MRILLLIATLFLSGIVAEAQTVFFPTKKGTVLEYKSYDKNDKEKGMIRYTITDVKIDGENMDITYLIESEDSKKEPIFSKEITVHKKGDRLHLDMSKFLSKESVGKASGGMVGDIKITGNDMIIPSSLQPGDKLPDSNIDVAMKVGFMTIKMGAKITNRIVESAENIKVKAGNFDAFKITSKMSANAMGMKTNSTTTEWLAKGIGMVRSEEYDKNGKLNSYTELVSIKE